MAWEYPARDMFDRNPASGGTGRPNRFWMRASLAGTILVTAFIIWASHLYLTRSFSAEQSNDARLRATLYAGGLQTNIQRHRLAPVLLARDPILTIALRTGTTTVASERLGTYQEQINSGPILLLDADGRVVASSDPAQVDRYDGDRIYFTSAVVAESAEFSFERRADGDFGFYYSHPIRSEGQLLGVVVVTVDLASHEQGWQRAGQRVVISDSEGVVLLASEPSWRGGNLAAIVAPAMIDSPVRSVIRSAEERIGDASFSRIGGTTFLPAEVPVGFRNWRLTYFDTLEDVRARVNAILALIFMGLAILSALGFYLASRRTRAESQRIQRESRELRELNRRLSTEIATRKTAERNLKDAEQSLEQASKLAALGQMSAAVSHELNQPLAAMKTYLAGARLLLQRKRPEEALSSFQRIDDLINRMGGITRQLKSYARRSEFDQEPYDLRDSVREALAMMAPQLGKMSVSISSTLPSEPVIVEADALRIEQIIVNLLRNAIDAVRGREDRKIKILLVEGESVLLSIEDNGAGLEDPEKLFEPFHTTKKPGEGLGLGLAISAGFANEMGGRLVARNAPEGGAVFELMLPRGNISTKAAE